MATLPATTHDPALGRLPLRCNGKLDPARRGKPLRRADHEYADVLCEAYFPFPEDDDETRALIVSSTSGLPPVYASTSTAWTQASGARFWPRATVETVPLRGGGTAGGVCLRVCGWELLEYARAWNFGGLLSLNIATYAGRYIPQTRVRMSGGDNIGIHVTEEARDRASGFRDVRVADYYQEESDSGDDWGDASLYCHRSFIGTHQFDSRPPTARFRWWRLDHIPLCRHGGWPRELARLRADRGFPAWYR